MNFLFALVGIVLLFFGRRLFWFFIAASGFLFGMFLARDQFQLESTTLVVAIALLAGLLGALLSVVLQKVAVAVGGFIAGAYLGAHLVDALDAAKWTWLGFALGGLLGAILLVTLFEWTLILLSSLVGAAFLADGIGTPETAIAIFAAACVIGMLVQAVQLSRARKPVAPRRSED